MEENKHNSNQKIKTLLYKITFILLSTAAMVFFSEKTYWYVQGYAILELILYYAIPVAVCIWVIDMLQVQRLSGVVLVGGLYGFLVEGILTPVIYEGGLFDPVMPAYFVGWHGLLSVVFGWYLIRKWLVEGNQKRLLIGSTLFGLFWGLWSLNYRLPESIQEFEALVLAGEHFQPGAWPFLDYAFYTLVFTGMLMAAHWLLGRNIWQEQFSISNWGLGLLLSILVFLYAFQVFPIVPLGFLKLIVLVAIVVIPLNIQKKRNKHPNLLMALEGKIKFSDTLPLISISISASLVYGLAALVNFPDDLIRLCFYSIYASQAVVGGGFFIWAWIDSFKNHEKSPTGYQLIQDG